MYNHRNEQLQCSYLCSLYMRVYDNGTGQLVLIGETQYGHDYKLGLG